MLNVLTPNLPWSQVSMTTLPFQCSFVQHIHADLTYIFPHRLGTVLFYFLSSVGFLPDSRDCKPGRWMNYWTILLGLARLNKKGVFLNGLHTLFEMDMLSSISPGGAASGQNWHLLRQGPSMTNCRVPERDWRGEARARHKKLRKINEFCGKT